MLLIPLRSDRPLRSTPYVNYGLIAVNVLVFMATTRQITDASIAMQSGVLATPGELWDRFPVLRYFLWPGEDGRLFQLLTSQFLHGDVWHLAGNMLFLWVFGNNIEDRLGKAGYLFFYLGCGVFAGLGHWLTSSAPALGASGAVSGVTGAFLVLFPRTQITFLFWLFVFLRFFQVPAMVVVLFYFAKDVLLYSAGNVGVAYTAHIAGTLTGFAVGSSLLVTRLLDREPYDLVSLIAHKRRRNQFRRIARQGFGPQHDPNAQQQDPAILDARRAIARAAGDHDLPTAASLYAALIGKHPDQVLSERLQTDIANQLFGDGRHDSAAAAYELLLKTYPRHPEAAHYRLMLGLTYVRYLGRPADARPLLEAAAERLEGEEQALARELLAGLGPSASA